MKKFILFLFAVFTTNTAFTSSCDPYSLYQEKPWRFIEQIFVVEPEQKCQQFNTTIFAQGAAAVALTPAGWLGKKAAVGCLDFYKFRHGRYIRANTGEVEPDYTALNKKYNIPEDASIEDAGAKIFFKTMLYAAGAAATLSVLPIAAYKMVTYFIEKNIYLNAFKEFIKKWKIYKKITPEELHELFDQIYDEINNKTISQTTFQKIAPDIIEKIRQKVYEEYPIKYKNRLSPPTPLIPPVLQWTLAAFGAAGTVAFLTQITKNIWEMLPNRNRN